MSDSSSGAGAGAGAGDSAGVGGTGSGTSPGTSDVTTASAVPVIRRLPRRATTQPVPGSDPRPAPEPERHTLTENDDRLKAEKPPHY
jgi:ribosomal protein L15